MPLQGTRLQLRDECIHPTLGQRISYRILGYQILMDSHDLPFFGNVLPCTAADIGGSPLPTVLCVVVSQYHHSDVHLEHSKYVKSIM